MAEFIPTRLECVLRDLFKVVITRYSSEGRWHWELKMRYPTSDTERWCDVDPSAWDRDVLATVHWSGKRSGSAIDLETARVEGYASLESYVEWKTRRHPEWLTTR